MVDYSKWDLLECSSEEESAQDGNSSARRIPTTETSVPLPPGFQDAGANAFQSREDLLKKFTADYFEKAKKKASQEAIKCPEALAQTRDELKSKQWQSVLDRIQAAQHGDKAFLIQALCCDRAAIQALCEDIAVANDSALQLYIEAATWNNASIKVLRNVPEIWSALVQYTYATENAKDLNRSVHGWQQLFGQTWRCKPDIIENEYEASGVPKLCKDAVLDYISREAEIPESSAPHLSFVHPMNVLASAYLNPEIKCGRQVLHNDRKLVVAVTILLEKLAAKGWCCQIQPALQRVCSMLYELAAHGHIKKSVILRGRIFQSYLLGPCRGIVQMSEQPWPRTNPALLWADDKIGYRGGVPSLGQNAARGLRKSTDLLSRGLEGSSTNCLHCGSSSENAKKCSNCRSAYYCSHECQKADWKTHKLVCKQK